MEEKEHELSQMRNAVNEMEDKLEDESNYHAREMEMLRKKLGELTRMSQSEIENFVQFCI